MTKKVGVAHGELAGQLSQLVKAPLHPLEVTLCREAGRPHATLECVGQEKRAAVVELEAEPASDRNAKARQIRRIGRSVHASAPSVASVHVASGTSLAPSRTIRSSRSSTPIAAMTSALASPSSGGKPCKELGGAARTPTPSSPALPPRA